MKSLILLLGPSVLTAARDAQPRPTVPEVELPPLATTPAAAAAWRRWAAAGRVTVESVHPRRAPQSLSNPLGTSIGSVRSRGHV